ncbi:MAG: biotin transport system substrate-specific component [Flavobacteriales bacterium]|jgi:biotin transport system substrate-specific component
MFADSIRLHGNNTVNSIITVLIGIALISVLSPLTIDLTGQLQFTLQTYAIILVAVVFGWKIGLAATVGYFIVGISGVPVFPGYGSGIERLVGEYGGFYFGFLMAAAVCGYVAESATPTTYARNISIWLLGHLIVLLLGFSWLWKIIPPLNGWMSELEPLIPGMMIKVALGMVTVHIIGRIIENRQKLKKSPN